MKISNINNYYWMAKALNYYALVFFFDYLFLVPPPLMSVLFE